MVGSATQNQWISSGEGKWKETSYKNPKCQHRVGLPEQKWAWKVERNDSVIMKSFHDLQFELKRPFQWLTRKIVN
jgi:hypothetical protein